VVTKVSVCDWYGQTIEQRRLYSGEVVLKAEVVSGVFRLDGVTTKLSKACPKQIVEELTHETTASTIPPAPMPIPIRDCHFRHAPSVGPSSTKAR
jgi:hypothetical protein